MRRAIMAGVIAATSIAVPAQAQRCWNQASVEAAQVKEFEIMLMVATLRCQAKGLDLSGDYNGFIAAHRPALRAAGEEIVRELKVGSTAAVAMKAYDKLGVVLANKYGNGVLGLECLDFQAIIAEAKSAATGKPQLVTLAQRAGMNPELPGPRCTAPVAAAVAGTAVAGRP